jgi:hypothetical protein
LTVKKKVKSRTTDAKTNEEVVKKRAPLRQRPCPWAMLASVVARRGRRRGRVGRRAAKRDIFDH